MQEVNEAWRVLQDPGRRRDYDRALLASRPAPPSGPPPGWEDDPGWDPDADLDPRPYHHAIADPGDVGIRVVRHLPWLVLVAVVMAIFVFTAYAGGSGDDAADEGDLVGRCVRISSADGMEPVPCSERNDGEVVLVDFERSGCPADTFPHTSEAGGNVLCVRPS